ncbi:MAG: ABC transporter ATP-binding protein [Clostridia bacterium]|nr:ABC transporter ATP-binding protein [Clostridia bacterium]
MKKLVDILKKGYAKWGENVLIKGFIELDKNIKALMDTYNLTEPEAVLKCDMDADCAYGEVWLLAYKDRFVTIDVKSGMKIDYDYDSFEMLSNESFINTGQFVIKRENESYPVAFYSNSVGRTAGRFAMVIGKLKENKELTEEDFKAMGDENACPTCGRPYRDPRRKICPKCMNRKAIFIRLLGYLPKYKFSIALMGVFMVLTALIGVLRPYVSGATFYDEVLTEGGKYYGMVVPIVLCLILLEVSRLTINILKERVAAKVSANIVFDIKSQIFGAMQRLSMSFFNSQHTGSLMNRVNNDAEEICFTILWRIPELVINSLTLIGTATVMLMMNPLLSLIVFIPVPFTVYMMKVAFPKFRKVKNASWQKRSKLNSVINDALAGIRVVKAFGKETNEIDRFDKASGELYEANIREGIRGAKTFPVMGYITSLGGLFVWAVGGAQVMNAEGGMTFGMLMTFVGYMGMVLGPIDSIVNSIDWLTECLNCAHRLFEIIDRKSDVVPSPNPVRMEDIEGHICLKDVTFSYEPNKPVLKNINLDIKKGEMIGLVGHSGAGKSTITNIITRLYDVEEGAIEIDGVNIKDIHPDDLHRRIGMVLQETHLFSGTIMENIAFARPDATYEEVVSAAKLANAHDFIMKLPDGYETELGKRHTNLSGGERQRINIARAILLDPRILILDEATASVDTETELQIQQAINTLTKGRTTIAIAHRLSTLKNADRLVVVDRGEIAEMGTHAQLEASGGIYAGMLGKQKEALKIRGVEDEE